MNELDKYQDIINNLMQDQTLLPDQKDRRLKRLIDQAMKVLSTKPSVFPENLESRTKSIQFWKTQGFRAFTIYIRELIDTQEKGIYKAKYHSFYKYLQDELNISPSSYKQQRAVYEDFIQGNTKSIDWFDNDTFFPSKLRLAGKILHRDDLSVEQKEQIKHKVAEKSKDLSFRQMQNYVDELEEQLKPKQYDLKKETQFMVAEESYEYDKPSPVVAYSRELLDAIDVVLPELEVNNTTFLEKKRDINKTKENILQIEKIYEKLGIKIQQLKKFIPDKEE